MTHSYALWAETLNGDTLASPGYGAEGHGFPSKAVFEELLEILGPDGRARVEIHLIPTPDTHADKRRAMRLYVGGAER